MSVFIYITYNIWAILCMDKLINISALWIIYIMQKIYWTIYYNNMNESIGICLANLIIFLFEETWGLFILYNDNEKLQWNFNNFKNYFQMEYEYDRCMNTVKMTCNSIVNNSHYKLMQVISSFCSSSKRISCVQSVWFKTREIVSFITLDQTHKDSSFIASLGGNTNKIVHHEKCCVRIKIYSS